MWIRVGVYLPSTFACGGTPLPFGFVLSSASTMIRFSPPPPAGSGVWLIRGVLVLWVPDCSFSRTHFGDGHLRRVRPSTCLSGARGGLLRASSLLESGVSSPAQHKPLLPLRIWVLVWKGGLESGTFSDICTGEEEERIPSLSRGMLDSNQRRLSPIHHSGNEDCTIIIFKSIELCNIHRIISYCYLL